MLQHVGDLIFLPRTRGLEMADHPARAFSRASVVYASRMTPSPSLPLRVAVLRYTTMDMETDDLNTLSAPGSGGSSLQNAEVSTPSIRYEPIAPDAANYRPPTVSGGVGGSRASAVTRPPRPPLRETVAGESRSVRITSTRENLFSRVSRDVICPSPPGSLGCQVGTEDESLLASELPTPSLISSSKHSWTAEDPSSLTRDGFNSPSLVAMTDSGTGASGQSLAVTQGAALVVVSRPLTGSSSGAGPPLPPPSDDAENSGHLDTAAPTASGRSPHIVSRGTQRTLPAVARRRPAGARGGARLALGRPPGPLNLGAAAMACLVIAATLGLTEGTGHAARMGRGTARHRPAPAATLGPTPSGGMTPPEAR